MSPSVSVIIPTLNAASEIGGLIGALEAQSLKPEEILVVDSSSDDETVSVAQGCGNVRIHVIPREDFNHGTTQHEALGMTSGDYVCFMTQDAVPADKSLLASLVAPMEGDSSIALVSGRQLPKPGARRMEQLVREFNYPDTPNVRGKDDVAAYGIKAFFASDACAAYRRSTYLETGGFQAVETNEDMLMAARLISCGHKVAYESAARVYHSHDLKPRQQYERNRAIGRFLAIHEADLMNVAETGEGARLVRSVAGQLLREGRLGELLAFGADCAARLAGNRAGRRDIRKEMSAEIIDMTTSFAMERYPSKSNGRQSDLYEQL